MVLGAVAIIARIPLRPFVRAVREPFVLAFSTASSEAALPLALENMELMGVPPHIVAFVLPTGYSFNLDGSTLYLSMASIFVAQAAGIHMPLSQQLLMMLTLMLTSKGVAAVPTRVACDPGRNARDLRPPALRRGADPGRRRADGHGADIGEPARQLHGDRSGGALGRRRFVGRRAEARRGGIALTRGSLKRAPAAVSLPSRTTAWPA